MTIETLQRSKEEVFTVQEVSKGLKVSENFVRGNCKNGNIEHYRMGSEFRVTRQGLIKFLKRQQGASNGDQAQAV